MLARFERLMESALEGGVRRVFSAQLQPVQLAKAAARAMEEAQVIGVRGTEVPNSYTVRVSEADLDRFHDYRGTLAEQIRLYLIEYAADRGFHLVADPRVVIEVTDNLRPGTIRSSARYVDLEPAKQSELDRELEGTRALRVQPPRPGARIGAAETGRLIDILGTVHQLDPEGFVVRIGRATDNDITVNDSRVSRYHTQLRWESGGWVVHDLRSTNGTFLNSQPVTEPRPLTDGAVLRLGDYDFTFRADG